MIILGVFLEINTVSGWKDIQMLPNNDLSPFRQTCYFDGSHKDIDELRKLLTDIDCV